MARVVWTDRALRNLEAVHDYIANDSPDNARKVLNSIILKGDRLADFDEPGSIVPECDSRQIREVFIYNYRVIFRLTEDQLEVLTVIHSARQLPDID